MRVESGSDSDSEWLRPLQLQLNHECQKNAESSHQWLRPWPQGHSESLSLSEAVSITVSQTVTLFSCFGSRGALQGTQPRGFGPLATTSSQVTVIVRTPPAQLQSVTASKRRSCCAATAPLRELALRSAAVGLHGTPLEKSPSQGLWSSLCTG